MRTEYHISFLDGSDQVCTRVSGSKMILRDQRDTALLTGNQKEGRPSRPDSSVGMGTGLNRMVGKVQRDKLDHYREGRSAHRGFAGQEYRN